MEKVSTEELRRGFFQIIPVKGNRPPFGEEREHSLGRYPANWAGFKHRTKDPNINKPKENFARDLIKFNDQAIAEAHARRKRHPNWLEARRRFPDLCQLIEEGKCPRCEKHVAVLMMTGPHRLEFEASGLCQPCQKEVGHGCGGNYSAVCLRAG